MRAFDIPQGASLIRFVLDRPTALSAAATSAGFDEVAVTRSIVPYEYSSADAFVRARSGPHARKPLDDITRATQQKQQAEFWRAHRPTPLGRIRAPTVWCTCRARSCCWRRERADNSRGDLTYARRCVSRAQTGRRSDPPDDADAASAPRRGDRARHPRQTRKSQSHRRLQGPRRPQPGGFTFR